MTQNRDTLKDYFKKNAIPTEGNFAELIDSQLNQVEDGIFKLANEPLSLRPSGALPALRLHPSSDVVATGHWSLYLTAPALGTKPHLNIVDNDNNTHLFLDAFNRFVGLGTTTPTVKLDVVGKVNASGGVEAGTGISAPRAAVGYAWSSLGSATASLSVNGSVGIGTTAPAVGVTLDVVGKMKASGGLEASTGISATRAVLGYGWSSVGTATADLSVSGSVGVGTTTPTVGTKLDVIGKLRTTDATVTGYTTSTTLGVGVTSNASSMALHVAGNACVTNYLAVGATTVASNIKLYVGGTAWIQAPDANLYMKSESSSVGLYMFPASDSYNASIILYTDLTGMRGVNMYGGKATVNGVDTNRLSFGAVGGQPFQLFSFGGGYFQGDVTATGTITIGSWTLSVLNNALVLKYGGVNYAAVAHSLATNRFEVRTSSGYFFVRNDGSYGHTAGAPTLL